MKRSDIIGNLRAAIATRMRRGQRSVKHIRFGRLTHPQEPSGEERDEKKREGQHRQQEAAIRAEVESRVAVIEAEVKGEVRRNPGQKHQGKRARV